MILAINLTIFVLLSLLGRRFGESSTARIVFTALAGIGLLNAVHYTHLLDGYAPYYEYRSWLPSDFFPSLTGLIFGACIAPKKEAPLLLRIGLLLIGLVSVILPEIKSTMLPAKYAAMHERFEGEVVRQTTGSSCGPASLVTLLRREGVIATEREIAEACGTSRSGTEVWKLARFARRKGFECRFVISPELPQSPAIIGTDLGGIGHFIALLENRGEKTITVGDPLSGKKRTTAEKISYTGFAMLVTKRSETTTDSAANAGR